MSQYPVVIKQSNFGWYGIYFTTPGRIDNLWCSEDTIEKAIERGKDCLIAYIKNADSEELITPNKYAWHPELSRKEVMKILESSSNYAAFICGNKDETLPSIPKDLDQLSECGILFGGAVHLSHHIRDAIANNKPLIFSNFSGFTIDIPLQLAQEYLDYYHYV